MNEIFIRNMLASDIPIMTAAFARLGWNKPVEQYECYFSEQNSGKRVVLVALAEAEFAGYVNVLWQARYQPFREAGIPEIADFNVLPVYRQRGIGSRLMDVAEQQISVLSSRAGLGVGMTADYGAAQRLYARRGYVPDGCGLMADGQAVVYGQTIRVDDDLCLYLIKNLSSGV